MADQPNDVFGNEPTPPANPPVENEPAVDKYADLLKSIKNETGEQKYDSVEKALDALKHAQEYIPNLKNELTQKEKELEELRASKEKFENLDEIVKRLTAREPSGEGEPPVPKGLDEQAVAELVKKTLGETESQRRSQENLNKVQDALRAKFQDKAKEVVQSKAQELGTTPKQLEELAKQNPAMVLALFNATAPKVPSATTGDLNIPPINKPSEGLKPPSKSLLAGATRQEMAEYLEKIKQDVYSRHGVTT